MPTVIDLYSLGKRYWKLEERAKLSQAVLPFVRPRREELWALRHFDLSVSAGETVGVLGHNGAGKTTLLRLLAGVTSPTEGHLRVVGRIAPLISLGVGFHQEMSGRENVLVNGMLLGLTAEQVAQRFDSIVEFAELGDFIDTPVKFYSSGMFMRLGFAVVAHVDPTILLVDEILAVGDAGFRMKCFERLRQLRERGAAIIVVSHSLYIMRLLCERAVLIRHGELVYDGDVERAIGLHLGSVSHRNPNDGCLAGVEFVEGGLVGGAGDGHHADYDDPLEFVMRIRFRQPVSTAEVAFKIESDGGYPITTSSSPVDPHGPGFSTGELVELRLRFRARLGAGTYMLAVALRDEHGATLGTLDGLMLFVAGRPNSIGVIDLRAQITIDGIDRTDRRSTILGS